MTAVDRTDRRLLLAIRLVILPGFFAATYLSYSKIFDAAIVCTSGCEIIQASRWSEIFGIPVTVLGMLTYLLIFGSTFVNNDVGKLAGAFFATTGAAFSIWLQYQSLFVMEHFCPYCFTSAVCMQILAVCTIVRVVRIPKFDEPEGSADEDLSESALA